MILKKVAAILLTGIAATFAVLIVLAALSVERANAKGVSAARATISRAVPVRTSYVSRSTARKKSLIRSYVNRVDEVECSTLRNSRYSADREVYRRYCH